ncbi:hypothetical protein [Romeriopsis navalis]|nr:hypothetical protein [Romeriopsis navalis]
MGGLIDPEELIVFVYQSDQTPQFFDQPNVQLPGPNLAQSVA